MKQLRVFDRFIKQKLRLGYEEDIQATYQEIVAGTQMSGHNFWVLGFTMLIACIGLNIDSTAAVIDALLISPLMGPVVGFAFALAINDNQLKKTSIRSWLVMTIVSLLASAFFFLTPFYHNTNTLLSFTQATIFDIGLAFFGGLAGFIGIAKKDGTKVIAGVAVATACMPPLCTAGYGLAHADLAYLLGGLYFYLINCLFIGLATFLLSRFMGFHHHYRGKEVFQKTVQWLWILLIILMILPGTYIAYQKYRQEYLNPQTTKTERERIEVLEQKIKALETLINKNK